MEWVEPFIRLDKDTQLRPVADQDAFELFQLVDKSRPYLRAWLPWVDSTRTLEDERSFIRFMQERFERKEGFACTILYQGHAVGTIDIHNISWLNRGGEIGYWLGEDFQGKGLMTRACGGIIDFAFKTLELNKITIRCATNNMRSCAIPRRLGFTYEGIMRQSEWLYDHYVDLMLWGMLASEWK